MNVLMICYYWPPLADVGCRRSVSFAEYFLRHGWTPQVLSVRNPDRAFCSVGNAAPPDGVRTLRALSLINVHGLFGRLNGALTRLLNLFGLKLNRNHFYDLFCIPDRFFGWIPLAFLRGRTLLRRERLDLIYVSCSPFSGALVGVLLKKLSGLPLIVDFRDPLALEINTALGIPPWRTRLNRRIERFILRNVDRLVVTTEETRALYAAQYPGFQAKLATVHNGFEQAGVVPAGAREAQFTIIYAGQFYDYDPRNQAFTQDFFRALRLLRERGLASAQTFQFVYFGDGGMEIASLAREHGVSDLVTTHPPAPHAHVLGAVARAHLQLLRIVKPMISTKLFEGIALDVPFIATIPEGEVAELVRRYSPGSCVVTESSDERIADGISAAMVAYARGTMPGNRREEFLQRFSRHSLALRMMELMRQAAGHPPSNGAGGSADVGQDPVPGKSVP